MKELSAMINHRATSMAYHSIQEKMIELNGGVADLNKIRIYNGIYAKIERELGKVY